MDEAECQFLKRIDELRKLVNSHDEFDTLKISANLRLLLLDRLFHKANARSRLKIEFTLENINNHPSAIFWSIQDGLYPPTSHAPQLKNKTSLDGFLSTPIMKSGENMITVKDAIKYEAHVKGGVHLREPKTQEEVTLETVGTHIAVGGLCPSLRQLIAIGRVTLDAMKPLSEKLEAEKSKRFT